MVNHKFGLMRIVRSFVLGFLLPAAMLWMTSCGGDGIKQVPFEATAWKFADPVKERPRTVRSEMIADLLRRYQFTGWTRERVVELLGEPTSKWSGFEQWDMIYMLGLERAGAYSLDDEGLGFK